MYILLFLLFVTGDHCSCFSDVRFQPDTAIFKSDDSDVYAYVLCTWLSGVVTTKTTVPYISLSPAQPKVARPADLPHCVAVASAGSCVFFFD